MPWLEALQRELGYVETQLELLIKQSGILWPIRAESLFGTNIAIGKKGGGIIKIF